MHYRSVVALLFVFAAIAHSQAPLWSGGGSVSLSSPYNNTFGPFNLQTTATLTITYSTPVAVCIVYAQYMLPKWNQYNAENCLWYLNATKGSPETLPLPLLQFPYQIGVFLSAENPTPADNSTLHLELTGGSCPFDMDPHKQVFWDAMSCVPVSDVLTGVNDTFNGDFNPGDTKFWTYEAPSGLSHFYLSMTWSDELNAENTIISARYGAGSFTVWDERDTNGTLQVFTPRQGQWVFAIHSAATTRGSATFHLDAHQCASDRAGPTCTLTVLPAFNNMSLVITPSDGWLYLRFTVADKMPLLVSLTSNNVSTIPYLYAANGQIPYKLADGSIQADIHNCNRDYCNEVRSIIRNITVPLFGVGAEEWYIGIYTDVPGNTTFGLWFNDTCVPDCDTDNHGECMDSGRCQCEIDYEGLDCSISKGLGPQYIVLIIIASLVVASAIIGFVAWAYMRRKRANYEIVS